MGRKRIYNSKEEYLEAQVESKKKWREKNQDRVAYIRAKSAAKKFVNLSDEEDLEMLEEWLIDRKKALKTTEDN